MKKKLKLTKLTVVNLDRVKGGRPHCACDWLLQNGQYNHDVIQTVAQTVCISPCLGTG